MSSASVLATQPSDVLFWQGLSEDDRQALRDAGSRRRFDDGEFVFQQGGEPTHVVVILYGRLKLIRSSPAGREVLIEIRRPGTLVGELSVVDLQTRSTAARAMGTVDVLSIPSEQFRQLMTSRVSVSLAVLASVTRRLRQSVERRGQSGTTGVMTQLCGRLLEMADGLPVDADGSVEIRPSLTQQETADWLGVSRDAVVIALQRLRSDGLVETGRRRIRILDPDRMTEIVLTA